MLAEVSLKIVCSELGLENSGRNEPKQCSKPSGYHEANVTVKPQQGTLIKMYIHYPCKK